MQLYEIFLRLVLTMFSQVVLQFVFQLAFDNAFTSCITVSFFSVYSLTMLSQVVLQFLFSLLLIVHALTGCNYSFFRHFAV